MAFASKWTFIFYFILNFIYRPEPIEIKIGEEGKLHQQKFQFKQNLDDLKNIVLMPEKIACFKATNEWKRKKKNNNSKAGIQLGNSSLINRFSECSSVCALRESISFFRIITNVLWTASYRYLDAFRKDYCDFRTHCQCSTMSLLHPLHFDHKIYSKWSINGIQVCLNTKCDKNVVEMTM